MRPYRCARFSEHPRDLFYYSLSMGCERAFPSPKTLVATPSNEARNSMGRRTRFLEDEEKVGAVGVRRGESGLLAKEGEPVAGGVFANILFGDAMAVVIAFARLAGLSRGIDDGE